MRDNRTGFLLKKNKKHKDRHFFILKNAVKTHTSEVMVRFMLYESNVKIHSKNQNSEHNIPPAHSPLITLLGIYPKL